MGKGRRHIRRETAGNSVYFYVSGETPVAALRGLLALTTGENEITLVLHDPPALKEFVFVMVILTIELDDAYNMNTPDGIYYWLTISDLIQTWSTYTSIGLMAN